MSEETKETTPSLAEKLLAISEEIGFIEFDAHNPMYKSGNNYASAAGVIRKLNASLVKHRVYASTRDNIDAIEQDGQLVFVSCMLTFRCVDSGEELSVRGVGAGKDKGDKAVMKAATAAYKYAIAHAFTLGWGAVDPEDPKNDASAPSGGSRRSRGSSGGGDAEKPPRSRRSRRGGAKVDVDALLTRISEAESVGDLKKMRKEVLALRGDDRYSELRAAHKDALTAATEKENDSE